MRGKQWNASGNDLVIAEDRGHGLISAERKYEKKE